MRNIFELGAEALAALEAGDYEPSALEPGVAAWMDQAEQDRANGAAYRRLREDSRLWSIHLQHGQVWLTRPGQSGTTSYGSLPEAVAAELGEVELARAARME